MKKIFIKYNPYKLKTSITVNGSILPENSVLRDKSAPGTRLQEWVEELPRLITNEFNDSNFQITFHGILADFEDLEYVLREAKEQNSNFNYQLERIPAKETTDKEILIDEIFDEIQKGPFSELRSDEILSAFEHAKSRDFEVCVVATMSAGKSTLINALLGQKLMPSKQEACTAIITRLKDNDTNPWQAEVYDRNNYLLETHSELTYETMRRLNDDSSVALIKACGEIPFLTAEDISLVLIDTPGPNNARNADHRKIQSSFLGKSSKSLVLYVMEGTFGSDDDNSLLKTVANSMSTGGKQSKDRFIFVINKMDARSKDDGPTEDTLERVRSYLADHGIQKPNLFPVAALPALLIRMMENGTETDEDVIEDDIIPVRNKMIRRQDLHLEEYATLPASLKDGINHRIENADKNEQAIIHTGIPSVEAAIRQYVQKYAKTAKIKNIVDTFIHKLDEVGCFEQTKHEIESNMDERDKVLAQICIVKKKLDDAQTAQSFRRAVDESVKNVNSDASAIIESIIQKFQQRITKKIDSYRGEELDLSEVQLEIDSLKRFAARLEPEFQGELDDLLKEKLVLTANKLLEEYRAKLISLTEEIAVQTDGFVIEPLKLIGGSMVQADDFSIRRFIKEKEVEDGEEWVENTDKKWYKPWTWFQEKGYWRTKYKKVKYVKADELAQECLSPLQEQMWENGDNARIYAQKQSKKIAEMFTKEFDNLNRLIVEKMKQLEAIAADEENIEQRLQQSERKLKWLSEMQAKINAILEI